MDTEPVRLQVLSEPYVVYTKRGYQPALDVFVRKQKRTYTLFIAAKSLTESLEHLRSGNGGRLSGLEFWIRKIGFERTSQYELSE